MDNVSEGWTILDVGCNTGLLAFLLCKKAAFVYGIEVNKEHVDIAKSHYNADNIEYICADATNYDYSSCRPIDCVTLSNVLEHRVDFLKRIIRQVNWAREEQKRFLFRAPQIDREWLVPFKKEMGVEYRLDRGHHIEYMLETFTDELSKAGISITKYFIRFGEIYAVCEA